jgi:hypothetical protein
LIFLLIYFFLILSFNILLIFLLGNIIYFGLIFVDLSWFQINTLIFSWFFILWESIFLII